MLELQNNILYYNQVVAVNDYITWINTFEKYDTFVGMVHSSIYCVFCLNNMDFDLFFL